MCPWKYEHFVPCSPVNDGELSKNYIHVREGLFNMTRWDEDIEGWLRKFLDSRKGGSENCIL